MIAIERYIIELDEDEGIDRFFAHARAIARKADRRENFVCQKRLLLPEMAMWEPLATALQQFLIDKEYDLERRHYSCDRSPEPLPTAFIFRRRGAPMPDDKRYKGCPTFIFNKETLWEKFVADFDDFLTSFNPDYA